MGFSKYAINQLCQQGVLPFVKIGGRKYILMDLAEEALATEALANQEKQRKVMEDNLNNTLMNEIHIGKKYT